MPKFILKSKHFYGNKSNKLCICTCRVVSWAKNILANVHACANYI